MVSQRCGRASLRRRLASRLYTWIHTSNQQRRLLYQNRTYQNAHNFTCPASWYEGTPITDRGVFNVASLWRVPDQSTAFLMPEFYRQLQNNRDKARALRQAMLETKKKYPNPSDWAAFIFIGEAQ